MPWIDRVCASCGHRWEDLVGVVKGPDLVNCPVCDGNGERQVGSVASVTVYGTEGMTPGDLASALNNKQIMEKDADKYRSGELGMTCRSSVPLALRPDFGKRFH